MMMFAKLLFGLFILVVLPDELVNAEPTWTSLRATWALNVFSSRAFAKLPRRESKARTQGWTKIQDECSGKFLGTRYIKGEDPALVLLYDVNGYIAGVQNGIPKRDVDALDTSFSYSGHSAYQLDTIGGEQVYFLTAYFVEPSIICHEGRTSEQYEEEGTGTGLYFQNGTNPIRDAVHVPLYQEGMNVTHWVRGGCFPTMGVHYWYNAAEHMNCNEFFPATVIYNRGKLTSFAFVNFGKFEFSSRFEHPPQSTLGRFLPTPIPKCVEEEYPRSGGFSSVHIFFSIRPWNILC